ncbi:MAG: hypothetical protein AAGG08_07405, partial [Actinomycetota bacterium]
QAVADAAIRRGDVDDLVRAVGGRCTADVAVYWGSPMPDRPPGVETTTGSWNVEGQRLTEWIQSLPATETSTTRIDQWWQAVVVGVGRPDPLD